MRPAARLIAVAGLGGALFGCAQQPDPPPRVGASAQAPVADSFAAPLLGAFAGVLPCADCAGIRTELGLYAEQPSARPTRYESTETYLGTPDGDRTVRRTGRWAIMRGTASDPDATVYQLDFNSAESRRNFLRVGRGELRLLDRDQREIAKAAPHSLHRLPDEQAVEPIPLAERDSGRVVDVARGRTVAIRLGGNPSTGYRWTLSLVSPGVLTPLGEPAYIPADTAGGAVGRGGVEAWSFLASQSGRQELRFDYRRPWERDAPAARTLRYTIAVR